VIGSHGLTNISDGGVTILDRFFEQLDVLIALLDQHASELLVLHPRYLSPKTNALGSEIGAVFE